MNKIKGQYTAILMHDDLTSDFTTLWNQYNYDDEDVIDNLNSARLFNLSFSQKGDLLWFYTLIFYSDICQNIALIGGAVAINCACSVALSGMSNIIIQSGVLYYEAIMKMKISWNCFIRN